VNGQVSRHDVPAPRYTSYPTVPFWGSLDATAHAQALASAGAGEPTTPLSLYVHLPFCRRMCTFCGCNVVVTRDPTAVDRYLDHVAREVALVADLLGLRRSVAQLHWGGGTPTFLNPAQLGRLWQVLARQFRLQEGAEVAIEVDPRVTSVEQLATLRALGFNRLSLGVQDLDPGVQAAIGRHQSEAETVRTLEVARALGFPTVSCDLVYGLPGQTPELWQRTLSTLASLAPDRIALYSFALVPSVRPQQRRLAQAGLPTGGAKLDLYLQARDLLAGAGYRSIGMDHFARPDDELSRALDDGHLHRNFQGYTVRRARDVVAFGMTGISDVAGTYTQNAGTLREYYAAVADGRLPTRRGLVTSADDRERRAVIDDLMCRMAVDLGDEGAARYAPELERLRPLERDGLVRLRGPRIEVTEEGRPFLRVVAMQFDAYLNQPGARPALSRSV
jgi:oxygen-independent coproporphyrinogen-3 oxidase